ncbi:MAG: PQQ-binding-like beta-propeller repeat protein, partial [Herpetosiphonaceae bacterium]|nr:PQQ-binding-like beta-propeller repeat protein [Herpetosiphonaceae bacterium]
MIHSPSLLRSRKGLTRRPWFIPSSGRVAMPVLIMVLFVAGSTRPSKSALLDTSGDWSVSGQNLSNTRYQAAEGTIGVHTVGNLAPKWSFTHGGNVTATPAVVGGAVYVPGWAGNLSKLDATSGALIWSHAMSDYTGVPGAISRTSPAVANNTVFVGTLKGADVVAVDATTGDLLWLRQLDTHPYAQITQSPVVYNGVVYVGVSSDEEQASTTGGYTCCTFRGSIAALDATTGRPIWQSYTIPPNGGQPGGYSGAAVWSSSPVVDADRNALYITTGDNYSVPSSVSTCIKQAGGASCNASNDYFDSILALDLTTGDVKWAAKTVTADAWSWACLSGPRSNCPLPAGPDFDFGAGANLFQATINGRLQT